jgi:hypothetical protein
MRKEGSCRTQVITAAKNPVQMEAVAASGPCRDEKKVPTSAGSAEPVKIPVIFYHENIVSTTFMVGMFVESHINKAQIYVHAVKHGSECSHKNGKASNAPMPCAKNLGIRGFGVDVCEERNQRYCSCLPTMDIRGELTSLVDVIRQDSGGAD